ncbi:MAG: MurR/RpiR family transcriptional regulator [Lachnospiraceae bacterium]|nr:MurR/RpiR family transcriptional regulator [Lachnospiraceae bacterium]
MSLHERIRDCRENGSKGHRKIAAFLLDHAGQSAGMTAAALAQAAEVSEPTVVRFAKELGFDGYPEFQQALRSAIKNQLTSTERLNMLYERKADSVLSSALSAEIHSLKETLAATDEADFQEVVRMLLSARRVYIVGTRSSSSLANYFYFYASLILDNVHLVQNANGSDLFEQMIRVGSGDVVFGITFPRYSSRTVDAMTIAKKSGAKAVALTDSEFSPLVSLADKVLYAPNDVSSFVDSLVAPMALVNALISALGVERREETSENLAKLEKLWEEYTIYDRK